MASSTLLTAKSQDRKPSDLCSFFQKKKCQIISGKLQFLFDSKSKIVHFCEVVHGEVTSNMQDFESQNEKERKFEILIDKKRDF